MQQEQLREIVDDLDQLLGVEGDFWNFEAKQESLNSAEQVEGLMRDLLVDLFGLDVRGL
ncbi:MAG: hypothetical protein KC910_00555 [Candidatus Eremiobacteraeota bacterium]|nr:hypothetical protein [Candidatus Eremiobacteraeota bacterium]